MTGFASVDSIKNANFWIESEYGAKILDFFEIEKGSYYTILRLSEFENGIHWIIIESPKKVGFFEKRIPLIINKL
jgi:hypothetical protein